MTIFRCRRPRWDDRLYSRNACSLERVKPKRVHPCGDAAAYWTLRIGGARHSTSIERRRDDKESCSNQMMLEPQTKAR
ncbi:hypothetical protein JQ633_34070 [Bradyrhizobium tropiciagri]|uniref:hypothetical protein n=1 Tax=Bradyrhizobium tropiciagri TaxID=312253 RepID=UPI001BA9CAD6|nr:hypothetical protein [Bradyrhizobium tropiciagri]MBR0875424.1 hypothetical protein [Bradyrhizobium tropiciagri]